MFGLSFVGNKVTKNIFLTKSQSCGENFKLITL